MTHLKYYGIKRQVHMTGNSLCSTFESEHLTPERTTSIKPKPSPTPRHGPGGSASSHREAAVRTPLFLP